MSTVKVLTTQNFTETVNNHDTVVIDFWAQWCQPCKNFSRIMEQVAVEYKDVLFAKVDIEAEKELAKDFNIVSVPFVMVVRHKTVVYAEAGLLAPANLKELIDQALRLKEADLPKEKPA